MQSLAVIILTCLFPVILVTAIAVVVFFLSVWLVVVALAKVFRPGWAPVLNGWEALIAQELKSAEPNTTNICQHFIIDGYISTKSVRKMTQRNVFSLSDTKGRNAFSRLQQKVDYFLGYAFRTKEENFSVKDHIRDYDYKGKLALPNPCFEIDLHGILPKLLMPKWEKSMSPWEILLFHNYRASSLSKPQTVIIIRIHHSITDGIGILHFFETIFKERFDLPSVALPKSPPSRIKGFVMQLLASLRIPLDLAEFLHGSAEMSKLFLTTKASEEYYSSLSSPLDIETIQKLRNKYGVTYLSIVATICSSALRRVFEYAEKPTPDSIASNHIFPIPGHPKSLVNHFDFRGIRIPFRNKSLSDQLLEIDDSIRTAGSRHMLAPFLFQPLAVIPLVLAEIIFNRVMFPRPGLMLSVFIAQQPFSLVGCKVVDAALFCGGTGSRLGVVCVCYGTPGRFRAALVVKPDIVRSEAAVSRFKQFVEEETNVLLTEEVLM